MCAMQIYALLKSSEGKKEKLEGGLIDFFLFGVRRVCRREEIINEGHQGVGPIV